MKPRTRVLLFIAAVTFVTVASQWDDLTSKILDSMIAIPWSRGIVSFLKTNTQGLIAFILLGVFLELAGVSQSAGRHRDEIKALRELLDKAINAGTGRALMSQGLSEVYGKDAADQFGYNLFRESSIIKDMSVYIKVAKGSSNSFLVSVDLSYMTDSRDFYVGVTSNPLHAEAILSTGIVSEVFVTQDAPLTIPATIQRVITNPSTGGKTIRNLDFAEMSNRKKGTLFRALISQMGVNNLHIYEPKDASERGLVAGGCLYRIAYKCEQPRSLPYTFWMSDRVLQIKSIEVDITELGESVYSKAKLHRLLAASQWTSEISLAKGSCVLPLDTWLVAGQGVFVVWSSE